MTPKGPFLEGTFWDKFWRPIRSRALLFTPELFLGHPLVFWTCNRSQNLRPCPPARKDDVRQGFSFWGGVAATLKTAERAATGV